MLDLEWLSLLAEEIDLPNSIERQLGSTFRMWGNEASETVDFLGRGRIGIIP